MTTKSSLVSSDDFFKVDLHVHTPASGCYKGMKNDDEYHEIIRKYVEKDIKIIAITDHNSIKGYKKICLLKKDIENKIKIFNELVNKHSELTGELGIVTSELEELKEKNEVFKKITILPGVEFEASPGIHLLFIFDPMINLNLIDELLERAGYLPDGQGLETPDNISCFDVLEAIREAGRLGAIVIASHADSNKGIYNDLKGKYRANVFRSDLLSGISYNSPRTRGKIEALLQNDDYKRNEPVAFIQCSDYHGGTDEIGNCITYLKLEDFTFSSVCSALRTPAQSVSATIEPGLKSLIYKIASDTHTIVFEKIDNLDELKQATVAILNNSYGTLLIGVETGNYENIMGVKIEEDKIAECIKSIFKEISPRKFYAEAGHYEYGGNKVVAIFLKKIGNSLFYSNPDNAVYFLGENKKITKANMTGVAKFIERTMMTRLREFENLNNERIAFLVNELKLLKDSNCKFELVNHIEKECFDLRSVADLEVISADDIIIENSVLATNGEPDGKVIFIHKAEPRLSDAYLRVTAPSTNKVENSNGKEVPGKSVIIAPGGGVYINQSDNAKSILPLVPYESVLVLTIKDRFKDMISERAIVGWMKSSLFLWYFDIVFGDGCYDNFKKIGQIPIPDFSENSLGVKVVDAIDNIIHLENAMLEELRSKSDSMTEKIEEHNKKVFEYAREIDKLFFSAFELTEENLTMIEEFFELKKIFSLFEKVTSEEIDITPIIEAEDVLAL
ncbi:RNA-binding domain-containing protein [uncultured Anaeromusa sp.]|uniref:PHP domain-containing protein n=1 Tax=uncultured Anaeromusa sp. TaxID=673273 RepID=UPI0029C8E6D8|nr:RNA-binding domain-containing protein [uncultured Anaeromusa sp.]